MRADRLIAALLFLQTRERVTASELARELEVSERTARRDLEALAMSGVPLYSTHGRGGGWRLVGGARTDLTGLTSDEARSLFLALAQRSEPTATMPHALASAVRKLTSALPESFRADAAATTDAIKVDPAGWGQIGGRPQPPFVPELTDAIVAGHQVRIDYQRTGQPVASRIVHPLGLVTKRNVWYLVANTAKGVRTFRVDRVHSVEPTNDAVERPPNFNLDAEWERIVSAVESFRANVRVDAHVAPEAIGPLRWQLGGRVTVGAVDEAGWTQVLMRENSPRSLAAQIAGYGSTIRLVDPPQDVIDEMTRIANELSDSYPSPAAAPGPAARSNMRGTMLSDD